MITDSEDLTELINSIAKHEPDPAQVASKILAGITIEEARVIADVTLVRYVREVVTRPLRSTAHVVPRPREYSTSDGQRTPSAATAGIRDWVSRKLGAPVNIGPDSEKSWKFFGDCDRDDCVSLATARHRKSAELKAKAEEYERVAAALERYEAERVRDLPRGVLVELLSK